MIVRREFHETYVRLTLKDNLVLDFELNNNCYAGGLDKIAVLLVDSCSGMWLAIIPVGKNNSTALIIAWLKSGVILSMSSFLPSHGKKLGDMLQIFVFVPRPPNIAL